MAFRPLFSQPQAKALAVACAFFLVTYPVVAWVVPRISPGLALLIFAALLIGCGAVVGYLAHRSPLMHGVILGAFMGVLAIISMGVMGGLGVGDIASIVAVGLPALITMAIPGIVLCVVGAMIGDYLHESGRAP